MSYYNNDTDMYDVININKMVQGSLGSKSTTKKGKLHVKVRKVAAPLMRCNCTKTDANLFPSTCKLLQESKICSDKTVTLYWILQMAI